MDQNKSSVITWIKSGMDYRSGVELLVQLSGRPQYAAMFLGRERAMKQKLPYELCKVSQLANFTNWKVFMQKIRNSTSLVPPSSLTPKEEKLVLHYSKPVPAKADLTSVAIPSLPDEIDDSVNSSAYPPIVQRLILETAALFAQRRNLHALMSAVPERNSASCKSRRADLFTQIKSITDRLDLLYSVRKLFIESGAIPSEAQLGYGEPLKSEAIKQSTPFHSASFASQVRSVASLDAESLKKLRKNLQSLNSRDQSYLDFQSFTHTGQEKPLPDGPRRSKFELRINDRLKLLEAIEHQLFILNTK